MKFELKDREKGCNDYTLELLSDGSAIAKWPDGAENELHYEDNYTTEILLELLDYLKELIEEKSK